MAKQPKTLKDGVQYVAFPNLQTDKAEIGNRPLDKEHVAMLTESIKTQGLMTPLVIWNGGENGGTTEVEDDQGNKTTVPTALVIAGFHRLAAIRKLYRNDREAYDTLFPNGIPVMVRSGELQDVLLDQLRENVARKELDGADALVVMVRLRDEFKLKNSQIAKRLGMTDSWVSQIFSIEATLGKKAAESVKGKELKLTDAIKVASEVKKAAKSGKPLSEKEIDAKVDKAKAKRKELSDKGRDRAEKRVSAKALYKAYIKMPKTATGQKLNILENALAYLAGEEGAVVPEELVPSDKSGDE
jgi:hypothetical protein